MNLLQAFARYIGQSAVRRHLLFIVATFLTISFAGYYFGTFDQASHIPFLEKHIDSTLFPGDHFFDLRFLHYSYFWLFFEPFYRLGVLEISMFVTHVIVIYLTFWAIWRLSYTLFKNELTSLLSVIVFILPHVSFGGFTVFEFSLLNRTFVLPFLLLTIEFYLRKKYLLTFFLLGLMYNLHALSVNFVLLMVLFDCLMQFRKVGGLRTIMLGISIFLLGALPVLAWRFGSSPVDFSIHQTWFSIISRSLLSHLFYPFSRYPYILFMTIGGVSTIILFFISSYFTPSKKHNQTIINFIFAILTILVIEVITTARLQSTIIIESQIIRASVFLTIFCYFYLTNYAVKQYQSGRAKELNFFLLIGAIILSLSPFIALVAWGMQKFISVKRLWREFSIIAIVILSFLCSLVVSYKIGVWRPGIYIFAQRSAWYNAQLWANNHTRKDEVFITPPYLWSFYTLDWRVISKRSSVSTLSELLEAAFSPEYINYWKERFEAVAPGAIDQFNGNAYSSIEITKKAFSRLTLENLKDISDRFSASYLVVERSQQYLLPVVYKNQSYIIYSLKDL